MKEYKFFHDSDYGWLEVEFSELLELGIHQEISKHSYVSGSKVYLSEDFDAVTFFTALEEQKGIAAEVDIKFDMNGIHKGVDPRQMTEYDYNVEYQCCVCDGPIDVQSNGWAHGHNAQPIADGQCCSSCNMIVIQQRLEDVRSAVNDR